MERLPPGDQNEAVRRWSSIWNIRRHRIAAEVSERVARDLDSGKVSVLRIATVTPAVTARGLALELETAAGQRRTVRPARSSTVSDWSSIAHGARIRCCAGS